MNAQKHQVPGMNQIPLLPGLQRTDGVDFCDVDNCSEGLERSTAPLSHLQSMRRKSGGQVHSGTGIGALGGTGIKLPETIDHLASPSRYAPAQAEPDPSAATLSQRSDLTDIPRFIARAGAWESKRDQRNQKCYHQGNEAKEGQL